MNLILLKLGQILTKLDGVKNRYRQYENLKKLELPSNGTVFCGHGVALAYPQNIKIGEHTYINGGELLASPNAKIVIGKNCLISYNVHLRTDMHNYMDRMQLINQQGHTEKSIEIQDDVWVGYGAQIMAGVKIATGCVIGAGAVVTKNTEPYGVYAGVPARKIKERKSTLVVGEV